MIRNVASVKVDLYSNASAFCQRWAVSCSASIQTQTPLLSDTTLMQSVFRWPIESNVMSVKRSLEVELFSTHGATSPLSNCFHIDLSDRRPWPQNRKCVCEKAMNNALCLSMNSAYEWSYFPLNAQWEAAWFSGRVLTYGAKSRRIVICFNLVTRKLCLLTQQQMGTRLSSEFVKVIGNEGHHPSHAMPIETVGP